MPLGLTGRKLLGANLVRPLRAKRETSWKFPVCLSFAVLLALSSARAQFLLVDPFEEPIKPEEAANASIPKELSPEVLDAVQGFLKRWVDYQKDKAKESLDKETLRLVKGIPLDEAAKSKLDGLAPKVLEQCLVAMEKSMRDWIIPMLQRDSNPMPESIKEWKPEHMGRPENMLALEQTDAWKQAVKGVLTAEQMEIWAKREQTRLAKIKDELKDFLAASELNGKTTIEPAMEADLRVVQDLPGMDEGQKKKLKAAADQAVASVVKQFREETEKQFLAMESSQRKQYTRNRGGWGMNSSEDKYQPQRQPAWKEALLATLSNEQKQFLIDQRSAYKQRRREALAGIVIAEIDNQFGFSQEQREALIKLAEKTLDKLPQYYYFPMPAYYGGDLGQIWALAKTIPEAELSKVLDEAQLQRWKSIQPNQFGREDYRSEPFKLDGIPAPELMTEHEVERVKTRVLLQIARASVESFQRGYLARCEVIARQQKLSPESQATLKTAAKGSSELLASSQIANMRSWLQSSLMGVKPGDLADRFKKMGRPYFGYQPQKDPDLWTKTLESVLSDEQRKSFEAIEKERAIAKNRAIASVVTTLLEQRMPLKPEQRGLLLEKTGAILNEYSEDISRIFSFNWYAQGYYTLVPLALISDKDWEGVLDKKEIEVLKGAIGEGSQFVEQIKNNNKSRKKGES